MVAGAIFFSILVAPLSLFLLDYGFCYSCSSGQNSAMAVLIAINLPMVIPMALANPDSEVIMALMFPLNGAFWGCVVWLVWSYRQKKKKTSE